MKNTPRKAIESAIQTMNVVQADFNIGCSGAIADLKDVLNLLPFEDEINTWEKLRELNAATAEVYRLADEIASQDESGLYSAVKSLLESCDVSDKEGPGRISTKYIRTLFTDIKKDQ